VGLKLHLDRRKGDFKYALLGSDVSGDRAYCGRPGIHWRCHSSNWRRKDLVLYLYRAFRYLFDRPFGTKSLTTKL